MHTEPCRAYWLSRKKAEHPVEGSYRATGDCIPRKDRGLNHPIAVPRASSI